MDATPDSRRRDQRRRFQPPKMAALFALTIALGGWRGGLASLSDNSFFCHLQTGHWILEHGVPRVDIYSFTAAGTPWVAASWLADALYGVLDSAFGPFGIRLLGGLLGAAIGVMAYLLALRLARDRVRAMLLSMVGVGSSFTLWSSRPLLLALAVFVALIWIVEIPESTIGRHPLLSIPILMWLWVNIHGSFALGFVYLGLHCAGRWLDGAPPWAGRERRLVEAALVAFAVCFINPYGPALVIYPIRLLARHRILTGVVEWRSPQFRTIWGLMYAAWLATFVGSAVLGPYRLSQRDVLVSVPFLMLGLLALRNIAIAPLVTLPVASRAVASEAERPDSRRSLNWIVALLIVGLAVWWTKNSASDPDFDLKSYPVSAMRAVEAHRLLGKRLLSTDNWGDYLILFWWPRQQVAFDDRYDMYPTRISEDFMDLSSGNKAWHEILSRYDIDVVVWPVRAWVIDILNHEPGWVSIYRDSVAVVFAKKSALRPAADSAAPPDRSLPVVGPNDNHRMASGPGTRASPSQKSLPPLFAGEDEEGGFGMPNRSLAPQHALAGAQ